MALTPKNLEDICERIAGGTSLRAICREMSIPEATARYALKKDPEAFARFARARDLGFDALADECIEISDNRDLDPADRRVRIETRLKLLGKWSQRYGDKVDHTLSGPDGAPIEIASTVGLAIAAARELRALRMNGVALPPPDEVEALPAPDNGKDLL